MPGTVAGVTAGEAAEAAPAPLAFVAFTVNVYAVPFASPVTAHDVAGGVAAHVFDPGDDVTV